MRERGRPAWEGSTRKGRLPANWESEIRPTVLARDRYTCQLRYDGCLVVATDVDHKLRGDDHRLENLQAACGWCHQRKSSSEGAAARPRLNRSPEPHPALE